MITKKQLDNCNFQELHFSFLKVPGYHELTMSMSSGFIIIINQPLTVVSAFRKKEVFFFSESSPLLISRIDSFILKCNHYWYCMKYHLKVHALSAF